MEWKEYIMECTRDILVQRVDMIAIAIPVAGWVSYGEHALTS